MRSDANSVGAIAARVRDAAASVGRRAGPAFALGAWLALTALFALGGVAISETVAAAIWQSRGAASGLATLLGSLAGAAVAPTLSREVVLIGVDRFGGVRDRVPDLESASGRDSGDENRISGPTPCPCYG